MSREKAVREIIERVGDLPALPAVVSEVLRLTEDANSSTGDVCDVIEEDPGLTAKVLRVSNSSYYGMKQFVGTLKLALVILGVREVRNIVLGISVFETLNDKKSDARVAQEIWDHSLHVAGLAKKLATHLGLGLQGEEFISGLLSDIGKMSLLRQFDDPYAEIYKSFSELPQALCKAEREQFDYDHSDVAMALSAEWNLPRTLVDALWYQYPNNSRSLHDAKDPSLAAVVRIAKLASYDDFTKKDGLACLTESEAWEVLATAKNPILEEERRGILSQFVEELKDADQFAF
jgi:HD-like signal output (HDOD) protein